MNPDPFAEGLGILGLTERPGLVDGLRKHKALIEAWNDRLGLVSLRESSDLVVKHYLDSLAPWKIFDRLGFRSMADLGSGAGFPGIPLALTFPGWKTTLIERMERRAGFLETSLLDLGRTDVVVLQRTFEEIKDRFDLVTFRAFTPLEVKIVKKMRRLLAPGGAIAAYKGRRDVIDNELAGLSGLGLQAEVCRLDVPFLEEERHLVILREPE